MGLLSSLFSRSNASEGSTEADAADSVARARTRARQRLMGAVVLVGVGIIGFPLLFETQPRPIAVDVPIEIPRKDSAPPLSLPTARAPAGKASVAPSADAEKAPERLAKAAPPMITETADEAGLASSKPASRPAAAEPPAKAAARVDEKRPAPPEPKADVRADTKVEAKAEPKPETRPAPKPAVPTPPAGEAARAQALLEGKGSAAAPAASARYIVQIGAFADPVLAQQTRLKVERLGLVTYTHVAKTPDGERTRVRVGPVHNREEAEKMAAKIKAAGLTAAILTL
jgi:DedD protein